MMNTKKSYSVALTLSALLIDNNQKDKNMSVIKNINCVVFTLFFLVCVSFTLAQEAQAELRESSGEQLEYIGGYPTKVTAQKIYDELDFNRAVETYLWALPMASYGAMAEAHYKLGAGDHAVIVESIKFRGQI